MPADLLLVLNDLIKKLNNLNDYNEVNQKIINKFIQ